MKIEIELNENGFRLIQGGLAMILSENPNLTIHTYHATRNLIEVLPFNEIKNLVEEIDRIDNTHFSELRPPN